MVKMKKQDSMELASTAVRIPTHLEIAGRAFEIFMERGCQHGRNIEDWLQAERELKQQSEGDEIEAAVSERTLGGDEDATVGSGRREEYKKGF